MKYYSALTFESHGAQRFKNLAAHDRLFLLEYGPGYTIRVHRVHATVLRVTAGAFALPNPEPGSIGPEHKASNIPHPLQHRRDHRKICLAVQTHICIQLGLPDLSLPTYLNPFDHI